MAVFEGTLYAESLQLSTGVCVILPESGARTDDDGNPAVLYLLHGLSDNHAGWLHNTNIVRYAEEAGLAVVMPEVQRSFYCDMAYGLPYFTYLTEELPALCRRLFRLTDRRELTYIAGLSMGGYGALKAALRYPERYGAAASFSGAVDVRTRLTREPEHVAIVGDGLKAEDDLLQLTARAVRQHAALPSLYLTCGLSDFLYEDNARFRKQLDFLRIPYVYEEWAGAHEWAFWDRSVRQFIQFLAP